MWFPSGSEQSDSKMFVARALERMLAERDIKRSNNAALRKAAQDALERIRRGQQPASALHGQQQPPIPLPNKQQSNNVPLPAPGEIAERTAAQQSIEPFTLALKSQSKQITIIAIDCLQKLIAYNHLTSEDGSVSTGNVGNGTALNSGATNVIERVCEDLCACFARMNTQNPDDDVCLQIVKALLTIMASDRVEVHGDTLLLIIRTCFNIYLLGKQPIVQETASGSLMQMLNKIMSHVEEDNLGRNTRLQLLKLSTTSNVAPPIEPESCLTDADFMLDADVLQVVHDVVLSVEECNDALHDADAASFPDVHAVYAARCLSPTIVDADLSKNDEDFNDDRSIRSADDAAGTETPSPSSPTITSPRMLPRAISLASTASVPSSPYVPSRFITSPAVDRPSITSRQLSLAVGGNKPLPPSLAAPALNVYERDALNVFSCLCKISTKEIDVGKPVELRNKVLCLKLLLKILKDINPKTSVLRQRPFFVEALRHHLCLSLSRNGVSPALEVFQLSLSIFVELVLKFRVYLKVQIGVMFKEIFLNILESSSSSYAHKLAVVNSLAIICSDDQLIVDLYVNYDCDMSAPNVFARMIDNLSRVAQGKNAQALGGVTAGSQAAPTLQQQAAIRLKGFESLSSILTGLVNYLGKEQQQQARSANATNEANTVNDAAMLRVESSASQLSESATNNMPNGASHDNSLNDSDMQAAITLSTRLEELKIQKDIVEQGVALFAKKPRRGLEFLQQNSVVGDTPEEIAQLFHHEERLDKSQIGDLISENNDYSRAIMHAYIDQMDFARRDIVSALRMFLEGFRLPGEAQKIDRLMEKFASRYCETNSELDIFASADTAYVLAYSIIMLTTDLHSPQVKHKMTKDQYIRMNRGINDQQDLPGEFLSKIYDEIAENEIRMKPSIPAVQPSAGGGGGGASSAGKHSGAADSAATSRQKQLLYNLEMEQVSKVAHALMESASHIKSEFLEARDTHCVKQIFKQIWTPLLAAFSILLQDAMSLSRSIAAAANSSSNKELPTMFGSEERDYRAVEMALHSLRQGMHIACRYLLESERDAYLQALVGFTHLSTSPSSGSSGGSGSAAVNTTNVTAVVVDEKNLQAVHEIIEIAQVDGNYLAYKNWYEILKRISQLDLTHIVQDRGLQAEQSRQQRAAASSGTKFSLFRDPVSALLPGLNAGKNSAVSNERLTMDESSSQSPSGFGAAGSTLVRSKSVARATQDRALASTSPVAFAILQCLSESEIQALLVEIDRIFSASTHLDGESVVNFVNALCNVSLEELRQQPRPKIFCLQKIVEISYYNMDRIRLQWSRIWQVMSEYYKHVFLLENEEISCFAVDSLRQLSVKFLEKGEVAHFRFQNEFLKPFEFVLKKTQSNTVRDMAVRCIVHIANSQAARLRSGWKNIFNVFFIVAAAAPLPVSPTFSNTSNSVAATGTLQRGSKQQQQTKTKDNKKAAGGRKQSADDDAISVSSQGAAAPPSAHMQLLEISFEALSNVVLRVYEKHFVNCVESFQDCIKCLSEFACTDEAGAPDMSMEAIRLIRRCADCVADNEATFNERLVLMASGQQNAAVAGAVDATPTAHKSVTTPTVAATPGVISAAASSTQIAASHERAWVNGWFPVIFELTCVVCRCKLDVRTRALTVLFEILKTHGRRFKDVWWLDIFQVILRMFDGLKLPDRQQHEKQEWMTTTCSHALFSIVDVVTQHFDVLGHLVIEQVYGLITWCIQQQNNEQLARSAINCFETLVTTNADRFDAELWDKTCSAMCGLFDATLPVALLQWQPVAAAGADGFYYNDDVNSIGVDDYADDNVQASQQQQNANASRAPRRKPRAGSINSTEAGDLHQQQNAGRPTHLAVNGDDARNFTQLQQQQRAASELQAMLLNCVLQIELIQALDNMLFSSLGASRRQEAVIAKFFLTFDPYRTLETIRESAQTQALAAAVSGGSFTAAAASAAVGTSLTAFYATQKQLSPPPPRRLPTVTASPRAVADAPTNPNMQSTDRLAANTASNFASSSSDEGVLKYLSTPQSMQLARVLQQSCMLARSFNLNDVQRELLWREGLCGRSKPNLFKQETYSFVTLIRLHFALLQRNLDKISHARAAVADEKNAEIIDVDEQQLRAELFSIVRTTIDFCNDTLVYYTDTITHDNHRQAWTAPVLTLAWSLVQPTLVSSVMAFLQDVVSTALSAASSHAAEKSKNALANAAMVDNSNIPFLGLCEALRGPWLLPSKTPNHSIASNSLANGNVDADSRIGDGIYVVKINNAPVKGDESAAVRLLDSRQALSLAVYREFYRHLFLNLSKILNLIESPVEVRKATQCLFALNYLLFVA